MTIRVTNEMKELVARTAAHCGLSVSEVLRRCVTWARRHGCSEIVTESKGENLVTFLRGDFELPDGVDANVLRSVIGQRCQDALSRPSAQEIRLNFLCMNGDGLTPQAEDR